MIDWRDRRAAKAAVKDFEDALAQAQKMLKKAGTQAGDRAEELRSQAASRLDAARATLDNLQDRATAAARSTDDFVRDAPWKAIGVAAAVGIVVGMAAGRGIQGNTEHVE
ncbi:MAG: DUF883 family protein [Betaproteobacteria bacterium]